MTAHPTRVARSDAAQAYGQTEESEMNIRPHGKGSVDGCAGQAMAESNEPRKIMLPLSSGASEVLRQLFFNGPTWDGDVVTKIGRDELSRHGLINRHEGWQQLNIMGFELCIANGLDREKEARERRRAAEVDDLRKLRDQVALAKRQWIERWEGSGDDRGSSIWSVTQHGGHADRIALFGDAPGVHEAVSQIVALHNAAIDLP